MKRSTFMRLACVVALAFVATAAVAAEQAQGQQEEGWVSLFNGKNLEGWKYNEGEKGDFKPFTVEDGAIVAHPTRSHLFYAGPVQNANFKNFEFKAKVMTTPGANSGIFYHTKWQDEGWPGAGYEAQVNSTHSDPIRTGSLYGVKNVTNPKASEHSKDNEWFDYYIKVDGKKIVHKINGVEVMNYEEPADLKPPKDRAGRRLSSGTFAIQAHPPIEGTKGLIYYKDIMVKPLP